MITTPTVFGDRAPMALTKLIWYWLKTQGITLRINTRNPWRDEMVAGGCRFMIWRSGLPKVMVQYETNIASRWVSMKGLIQVNPEDPEFFKKIARHISPLGIIDGGI